MTGSAFTDRGLRPTEDRILAATGRAAGAWRALFAELRARHPDLGATWRYYADGKSWLLKVARKAKTVCWVSVEHGAFRVAFYFPERLVGALLESELSAARKAELREGAPGGKLRRVSVTFGPRAGLKDVAILVGLKTTLK